MRFRSAVRAWLGALVLAALVGGSSILVGVSAARVRAESTCGLVDHGSGAVLDARRTGLRATVAGALGAKPCSLRLTVVAPLGARWVAFTLSRGHQVLGHVVARRLRRGTTRIVLRVDRAALEQADRPGGLRARLRMLVPRDGQRLAVTRRVRIDGPYPHRVSRRFEATGAQQSFTVPVGVRSIEVTAIGAAGGGSVAGNSLGPPGGAGAVVTGVLPVHPGEVLYVEVGTTPAGAVPNFENLPRGGYNGGGEADGGHAETCGVGQRYGCVPPAAGGGGASDVRTVPSGVPGSPASRLIVAGGGGGGGGGFLDEQGAAGGNAQSAGRTVPGGGGGGGGASSQAAGAGGADSDPGDPGGAGSPGATGRLGLGGDGGLGGPVNSTQTTSGADGGGGGGGLFGGGGGAGGASGGSAYAAPAPQNGPPEPGGGGGGGSSLVPPGGTVALASPSTAPSITITYTLMELSGPDRSARA